MTTTQSSSGTIDGISYASTQYVYDTSGRGVVTDILYFDQNGAQVADRSIIGLNPMYSNLKTVNSDGTFTLKEIPPGSNGGIPQGYTLETFSSAGIWQREDVYTPIFIDPNNPGAGVSGYTDSNHTLVSALGAGSSGMINGSYYDMVEAHYNTAGQLTETDYLYDLNGSHTIVARQVAGGTGSTPNPVITVPSSPVYTTGGEPQSLPAVTVTDDWAANHPGTLALNVGVDSGSLAVGNGTGAPLTATPGSAVRITGTLSQINADLAQLTYTGATGTAGTAGTAHITFQVYDQAGVSASAQETLNVSSNPPTPDPVLTGPAQLSGTAGTPLPLSGLTFTDSWASAHAGSLALNVFTSFGTLSGTDGSGHALSGSGTASLHASGSVAQIDTDLAHLALNSTQAGSGSVRIEVYDQAGLEAVHLIGVTAHA